MTNETSPHHGAPQDVTLRREAAHQQRLIASELLASLDDHQRGLCVWPFPAENERTQWFYTPTDHGGVTLRDLRPAQQRLVMQLLSAGLSPAGYVTVSTIMGLENVLDLVEGFSMFFERDRARDPLLYFLRVFGDPATSDRWSWRFGGHHISLNQTIVNLELVSTTPCFLGADPASSDLHGSHKLRPLASVEDNARELVHALAPNQRTQAVVSAVAPVDHVTANRAYLEDGLLPLPLGQVWRGTFEPETQRLIENMQNAMEERAGLQPEHLEAVRYTTAGKGLAAEHMTADQRRMLRNVLDSYLSRVPTAIADAEMAKYEGDQLNALTFLWAGGIEPNQGHYYRVQGPELLLEYDNTQRNANHIHSVWRDPSRDFGRDALSEHYNSAHTA